MSASDGLLLPVGTLLLVLVLGRDGLLPAGSISPASHEHPVPAPSDSLFRPLAVDSIARLASDPEHLQLRVSATAPDPCWQVARAEIDRADRSIGVRMIGRRDPEEVCIQVLSPVHDTIAVSVPEPGSYAFSFWRSDSTRLDTTFTLPTDD